MRLMCCTYLMVVIPTRRAHPADIFVLPWRDEKFWLNNNLLLSQSLVVFISRTINS